MKLFLFELTFFITLRQSIGCYYTCDTCNTDLSSTGCTSCDPIEFRIIQPNNSCTCQQGYFDDGNTSLCLSCNQTCNTCTGQGLNQCTSCQPTQNRIIQSDNSCKCKSGYFESGLVICGVCHYSCANCTNSSSTSCNQCNAANRRTLYKNNSCPCNSGYTDNGSPMCTYVCDQTCQTCFDLSSQGCLTCNSAYPYFRTNSTKNMCLCIQGYKASTNGTCIPVGCSLSQYFDQTYQRCGSCDQTCLTCNGPTKQQCLSCNITTLRNLTSGQCQCGNGYLSIQNQVQCTNTCQRGYKIGAQCLNCHPICAQCTGGSPLDCTACQQTNYDELNTNQNGQKYYQNSPINLILNIRSYSCQNNVTKEIASVADTMNKTSVMITSFNVNSNKTDMSQTYYSLNILFPKQTFKSGQQYLISVQTKKNQVDNKGKNQVQSAKTSFTLNILTVAKSVTINGGNGVIGNTRDLVIQCKIFDFDALSNQVTDFTQYTFLWTCNAFMYLESCVNGKGQTLDTSSSIQNLTIKAANLAPYNSIQFRVIVYDKIAKTFYNTSVVYQVVDQKIPDLTISYDPNLLVLPINLNLQQQFKFIYQEKVNPDHLFYSANLYYNFDIVSTIVFHYSTVNFRIWDFFENFTDAIGTKFLFKGQVYNPRYLQPSTFTITMNVNVPPQKCDIFVTPENGVELFEVFLIEILNCQNDDFEFTYRFAYYQSEADYESDNIDFSLAKASLQTSFETDNMLSTYLPKSVGGPNIVLVLSVRDNIGGITNYTQKVTVTPAPLINETNLMTIVDDISDISEQLRYLQVISASLKTSNQTFPKLAAQMTQIVDDANDYVLTLEEQNQILQIQAYTSTQVSNLTDLISQQQSTNGGLVNQIKSTLNYTKTNPSTILNQQTHDKQQILNAQLDSQHILGATILQNLASQQNSSLEKNSTQYNGINQQNQQVMGLLNQSRQIKIQQMTPNEGTDILRSKFATQAVAIVTKNKLSEMLGQNIVDDTQAGFLKDQNEKSDGYFTFSYLQYASNPYSSDEQFPYANQGFQAIDLQITKQSSKDSKNLNKAPSINPSKQVSFSFDQLKSQRILIQQSVNSTAQKTNKTNNKKAQNVCVSKLIRKGWSAEECQTIITKGQISCKCNSINPTSVVLDFNGLFASSNSKIFSVSTFSAIQNLKWYKIIIIWIILIKTIIYIASLYLGWKKDKIDKLELAPVVFPIVTRVSQIYPQQLLTQNQSPILPPLLKVKDAQYGEISPVVIIEHEKFSSKLETFQQKKQILKTQIFNQPNDEDKLINKAIIKDEGDNGFQFDDDKSSPSGRNKVEFKESSSLLRDDNLSKPIVQNQPVKVLVNEIQDVTTFLVFFQKNHNLMNVYSSYEELSRPVRSSLIYLTLISSLAVTLYFGSVLSFVRALILSILSSIATTITILSFKTLLSAKTRVLNIIGIILYVSVSGFLIFVILGVIATTQSYEQTNAWSIQYSIQFIFDNTISAIVFLFIKYKFFRKTELQPVLV